MSHDLMVSLVLVTAVILTVLVALVAFLRFHKARILKRQRDMALLIQRCHRIEKILYCLSDRYLPLATKMLLLEYLIESFSVISQYAPDTKFQGSVSEYFQLLQELKAGYQVTSKQRVQSEAHLKLILQALQALPLLLRGLVGAKAIDKVTAREQTRLIRFSFSLARHDLLVKEAMMSLDGDKKARALDKLRLALEEMEKVSIFTQSEGVIRRLNSRIKQLEGELFGNSSRVG